MRRLHPHSTARAVRRALTLTIAVVSAALLASTAPASNATPEPLALVRAGTNPLVGGPWGVDTRHDPYNAYEAATGTTKSLLGKMALRPRVFWFNDAAPVNDIGRRVAAYIADAQDGNPDALVQMAVFRLWPEGQAAKSKPLSLAQRTAYRRWVDNVARAIGSARVAMVVEPDLPVALNGWRPAVRLRLARYATRVLSALPRTTVYLDAGSSDWLSIPQAVSMLRAGGIGYARGFSLGATHYPSTTSEIAYGTRLVAALRNAGFPRRRFVIDTADSARPFTWTEYWAKHPRGDFDNAEVCRTRAERRCVSLGIPPTTDVAAPRWGLSLRRQRQARAHVDAYLWLSRPWYVYASPAYFDLRRALLAASTSPY